MSGIRSGLRLGPDELDQVVRLARFKAAHPDVVVGDGGFGTMQARIPEQDGETVITRYTLRELLDKLDELLGQAPLRARRRKIPRKDVWRGDPHHAPLLPLPAISFDRQLWERDDARIARHEPVSPSGHSSTSSTVRRPGNVGPDRRVAATRWF